MKRTYKFLTRTTIERLLKRKTISGRELGKLTIDSYISLTKKSDSVITNEEVMQLRGKMSATGEKEFQPFIHLYNNLMYLQLGIESNIQRFLHGAYALESDINRETYKISKEEDDLAIEPVAITKEIDQKIKSRRNERLDRYLSIVDIYRLAYDYIYQITRVKKDKDIELSEDYFSELNLTNYQKVIGTKRRADHLFEWPSDAGCFVITRTEQSSPLISSEIEPEPWTSPYRNWREAAEKEISLCLHLDDFPESSLYSVKRTILEKYEPILSAKPYYEHLLKRYNIGIEWKDYAPPITLGEIFQLHSYGLVFFNSLQNFVAFQREFPEAFNFLTDFIKSFPELYDKIQNRIPYAKICSLKWLMSKNYLGFKRTDLYERVEEDVNGLLPPLKCINYVLRGSYVIDYNPEKENNDYSRIMSHYDIIKKSATFLYHSHTLIDILNEIYDINLSPLKPDLSIVSDWQKKLNEAIARYICKSIVDCNDQILTARVSLQRFNKIDLNHLKEVSSGKRECVYNTIKRNYETMEPWNLPAQYLVDLLR